MLIYVCVYIFSDAPLAEKLASFRGQSDSAIIAPKQHPLSRGKQKNEAERKNENRDNHVADINDQHIEETINQINISDSSTEEKLQRRPNTLSSKEAKITTPSPFDSCKEFLAKSGKSRIPTDSAQQSQKIPSSRSVTNIRSCLVEEKASLTDVHCGTTGRKLGEDLFEDEVEIVSLLEEQIPRYKLRADTLTQFSGLCSPLFKLRVVSFYECLLTAHI